MRVLLVAAVAAGLIGCRSEPQSAASAPSVPQPAQPARSSISGLELVPVTVRSGDQTHDFTAELAVTREEQAQGLMWRQHLGPNEAMLFPMNPPKVAGFWMKNTLIPLDMIFIRADGTIARIAANTVPHSEVSVESGEPVAAVFEIAGGRAAELGIEEGDRVSWPGGPSLSR